MMRIGHRCFGAISTNQDLHRDHIGRRFASAKNWATQRKAPLGGAGLMYRAMTGGAHDPTPAINHGRATAV